MILKDIFSLMNIIIRIGNLTMRLYNQQTSPRILTEWLEYFSKGFLVSISNVKDDIVNMSHFDRKMNDKIRLNEKEIKIFEFIEKNDSIKNKDVQDLLNLSSQQSHFYIRSLIEKGLIKSQKRKKYSLCV